MKRVKQWLEDNGYITESVMPIAFQQAVRAIKPDYKLIKLSTGDTIMTTSDTVKLQAPQHESENLVGIRNVYLNAEFFKPYVLVNPAYIVLITEERR